jgi:hypothetical protein
MEVWCCIRVYENVSRDAAQLRSEGGVPYHSVSVWQSGNRRRWVEIRVKNTPLECMISNFKKGFNGDYGVKLSPNKLKVLCELDWPAFGVRWTPEGSLDKTVINEVYRVIVKKTLTTRRMGKAKRLKLVFKHQTLLFI